jgi:hypothetical protein
MLKEEHKLRVSENRLRRRILGSKEDEVMDDSRKLRNDDLRSFYSSADVTGLNKRRKWRWS